MDWMEAIRSRHSVRQYLAKPLEGDTLTALQKEIDAINREAGLHFQLVANEPKAFDCAMAHYGKFSGVTSYVALVGPKGSGLGEKCGYYGERLALAAQQLGLNTCWVGSTFKKKPECYNLAPGEKVVAAIAIGYGANQGKSRKSKSMCDVSDGTEVSLSVPEWYKNGVLAAMMAPTAMNRQSFYFERFGNVVSVEAGKGPFTKVDLGIVKCHFEIGAGKDNFQWMPEDM